MSFDHRDLTRTLADLRRIAAAKVEEDRLPTGLQAALQVREDLAKLQLETYAVDLETKGYTVLPPGIAGTPELVARLRDRILAIAAEDQPDAPEAGRSRGRNMWHILDRDPAFEEALMAPAPLALVAYLMGYRAKLSQFRAIVKDESSVSPMEIHADQSRKVPAPWPSDAQYCTITWCLTDYTRDNGAVCVFPGTHKLCTDVPKEFEMAHDHPDLEVIEAPAGSVILWHGGLWHGAVPRTAPGDRVTLVMPMVGYHLLPQEAFFASTTPEMLQRNSSRFAALMGLLGSWPWGSDGPDTQYTRPSWLSTSRENRFA
ncbi:phytanoyl-CoA dioxygenase family protein [Streptomyces mesophilus]|uniref:phytanoyl-CoA dioxygenase family protein n=1 Tax=Streptomyces mesophilus TaxID=1775132 RepID=UPI0033214FEB